MIPVCSQDEESEVGDHSLMGERLVSGSQCRVIAGSQGTELRWRKLLINGTSLLGVVGAQRLM